MLQNHGSMIYLDLPMVEEARAVPPFGRIPAPERRARGQQDVSDLPLVLPPDGLTHDELERRMPVRINEPCGVRYRAERRCTITIKHVDGRMSGRRVFEPGELPLQ